jgi:deoxycytidine triphosphate deaminase
VSLLRDQELVALVQNGVIQELELESFDPAVTDARHSPIQASSVDLHIGGIMIPGITDGLGSVGQPRTRYALATGGTAVVTTREELALPDDIAAFGFPPSRVSLQGLLMTNPGHVDPGYRGPLRFTVINMGQLPFELRTGDAIVTLLCIRLGHAARADWGDRGNVRTEHPAQEVVNQLSADFLNVESRAKEISQQTTSAAIQKAQVNIGVAVGVFAALVAGIAGIFTSWMNMDLQGKLKDFQIVQSKDTGGMRTDLDALRKDLDRMKADVDISAIKQRLDKIEKRLPPP